MRTPEYMTTTEAADYLRYHTSGGIRMAVRRGWLVAAGRGPRNVLLFRREDLDAFAAARLHGTLRAGCHLVRKNVAKENICAHQEEGDDPIAVSSSGGDYIYPGNRQFGVA
jgi:hypothetical protein